MLGWFEWKFALTVPTEHATFSPIFDSRSPIVCWPQFQILTFLQPFEIKLVVIVSLDRERPQRVRDHNHLPQPDTLKTKLTTELSMNHLILNPLMSPTHTYANQSIVRYQRWHCDTVSLRTGNMLTTQVSLDRYLKFMATWIVDTWL